MNFSYPICTNVQVDLLTGKNSVPIGCVLKNGVLTRALTAVATSAAPQTNLTHISSSKYAQCVLATTSDNKAHIGKYADATKMTAVRAYSAATPFSIEQRVSEKLYAVLFTDSDYIEVQKGIYYTNSVASGLMGGTVRCGRVFAGDSKDGLAVRWSGDSKYTDWTESIYGAGKVYLEADGGKIKQLFDFEDGIIIIRENGITRFSASGTPENFRVISPTLPIPAYCDKTAVMTGESIMFCTEDGLFAYKSGGIRKLDGLISRDIVNPVYAILYKDRYYAVLGDSVKLARRVLYLYDIPNDTCQIVDVPAYILVEDDMSLVAFGENATYRIQPQGNYAFMCGTFDFGTPSRKLITELYADCDGDVGVSISNGRYTKKVKAGGTTRLNMRGTKFTVTATGSGEVRALKLKAEVRK